MNYLDALKSNQKLVKETKVSQITETYVKQELTHEEDYIKNVEDSGVIYVLPELQLMCEEFVDTTIAMDYPLLVKHHTNYRNFVIEMMNLFEENVYVTVTETVESESESDEDLDLMDLYNDDRF